MKRANRKLSGTVRTAIAVAAFAMVGSGLPVCVHAEEVPAVALEEEIAEESEVVEEEAPVETESTSEVVVDEPVPTEEEASVPEEVPETEAPEEQAVVLVEEIVEESEVVDEGVAPVEIESAPEVVVEAPAPAEEVAPVLEEAPETETPAETPAPAPETPAPEVTPEAPAPEAPASEESNNPVAKSYRHEYDQGTEDAATSILLMNQVGGQEGGQNAANQIVNTYGDDATDGMIRYLDDTKRDIMNGTYSSNDYSYEDIELVERMLMQAQVNNRNNSNTAPETPAPSWSASI